MAVRQNDRPVSSCRPAGSPVRTDRSFALYVLLSMVTLSIYHYIFLASWAKDVNRLCEGDGEHTPGVGWMLLFSILTFGVYQNVWFAGIADRLYNNGYRYETEIRQDGETFFLWVILVPFLGYFIAMFQAIRNTNRLAAAAQRKGRVRMTRPQPERVVSVKSAEQRPVDLEKGTLLGLSGALSGMKIELSTGQSLTIGRSPSEASLIVEGEKISRKHCIVQYNGTQTGYSIRDCSRNGVLVNGQRIHSEQPTYVAPGSVVALADGANKFQLL